MPIRVFLVDDHELVRRGLSDLFESEPDIEVVGEAASVPEALARIPGSPADVAILDVRLGKGDGVELCRELKSVQPELNCLMLTSFDDDEALFNAIMAGASGFVLKQVLGADLMEAIRTVAAGGSLLDPRAAAALMTRLRREQEQADPLKALTEQERAVLELIGDGLSNREIAAKMFLAEKTVKNYVSHLLAKLGMQRRTQAAVLLTRLRSGKQDRG